MKPRAFPTVCVFVCIHGFLLPSSTASFHPSLVLSEAQVLTARTSHLPTGLLDCVQDIVMAAGHGSVRSALGRLRLYLSIDRLAFAHGQSHGCRKTLGSLSWQSAIARYMFGLGFAAGFGLRFLGLSCLYSDGFVSLPEISILQ